MENLAPDEKATMVMIYSLNSLVRGEVVTKESARVGVWPRTQGVPNLIHILKPGILLFGGSPPKALSYAEIFVPTASIIGFHLAPPLTEALDYDESEKNRSMVAISLLMGTFIVKGHVRVSSSAPLVNSLELVYNGWLSIYNSEITNPFLPQMPPVLVPMLLVTPNRINFMI